MLEEEGYFLTIEIFEESACLMKDNMISSVNRNSYSAIVLLHNTSSLSSSIDECTVSGRTGRALGRKPSSVSAQTTTSIYSDHSVLFGQLIDIQDSIQQYL